MRDFSPIYDLPNGPAVYAFYSGGRGPQHVTYVGTAGRLKPRIMQHLIRRDIQLEVSPNVSLIL